MNSDDYKKAIALYADNVYRVAYSYCKQRCDAEDVTHNTFVKLLTTETVFANEEHLRKWLIRVAANESKNLCQSFWKKRTVSYEAMEQELTSEAFDTDTQYDLFQAVTSLKEKYRLVVHLYYYERYSVKEIAETLGLKETTVQTRLQRARMKLKEMLKEEWEYE